MSNSSFTAKRLNASTILITEDDIYGEHPFIYVKIHPKAPVLIIGDTGCDKPSKHKTHGMQDCIHNLRLCMADASCRSRPIFRIEYILPVLVLSHQA